MLVGIRLFTFRVVMVVLVLMAVVAMMMFMFIRVAIVTVMMLMLIRVAVIAVVMLVVIGMAVVAMMMLVLVFVAILCERNRRAQSEYQRQHCGAKNVVMDASHLVLPASHSCDDRLPIAFGTVKSACFGQVRLSLLVITWRSVQ